MSVDPDTIEYPLPPGWIWVIASQPKNAVHFITMPPDPRLWCDWEWID